MNHDDIVMYLAEVAYRPGWTITAHRHPFGTYVLIDAEVLDSEKYDPSYPVEENYALGHTTRVGVRACVPPEVETREEFYDWLEKRLGKVEIHEMREFYQVGGVPWDSPHKRPQPRHDYHVRKDPQWGNWHVHHHDDREPEGIGMVLMTANTMRDAYIKAIYRIVMDDLRKGLVGPGG